MNPSTPTAAKHIDLSQPPSIPELAVSRATDVLRSGWLHRYGETLGDQSEASLLEEEFAAYVGGKYCVAVNSCGSSMFLALVCLGVKPGDKVLMNSFTLAPVPGAIAHAGAEHILVEITRDLVIDVADLELKAKQSGAKVLLLSHMRGHMSDMTAVMQVTDRLGIVVIEDCAHTMGATWAGTPSGRFGKVGCFSLQAYKHINAGEGGLLVTDDEDVAARAILHSGSYMLYAQHRSRPAVAVLDRWKDVTPNYSMRMSNLTAAIARPQLELLAERARVWNDRHDRLAMLLARFPGIELPNRPQPEAYVQSSIQFRVSDLSPAALNDFLSGCQQQGVYLKWFGNSEPKGYTSLSGQWGYVKDAHTPPATLDALDRLCDMRIPLDLPREACDEIATIIGEQLRLASASTVKSSVDNANHNAAPSSSIDVAPLPHLLPLAAS